MKKWKICVLLFILFCTGCGNSISSLEEFTIVTTLFPQYDFAKQIVKDKGKVMLLLKPGVESHHYDPTPSDILLISSADLFIYTGENMETWAHTILKGMDTSKLKVVDVSKGISLLQDEESNTLDPHIWTSPVQAKQMVQTILEAVVAFDPSNREYYEKNAKDYLQELDQLDQEFRDIVQSSSKKTMIFADRFSFHYFVEEYGLNFISAYDSCSGETEPSAKAIAQVITQIEEKGITTVFYQEFSSGVVADSIVQQTGVKKLLFHSIHNVTKEQLEQGASYLSFMQQNAKNLREGLQ